MPDRFRESLLQAACKDGEFLKWSKAVAAYKPADGASSLRHNIYNVFETQKYYLAAALWRQIGRNLVIIVENALELQAWRQALEIYLPECKILTFHKRELQLFQVESADNEEELRQLQEQAALLAHAASETAAIVLVEISAFADPLIPPEAYRELTLDLEVGMEFAPDLCVARLQALGYKRVNLPQMPGEFAKRGDIIDVVCSADETQMRGLRIAYFDNEIDQLKRYNLSDSRTVEQINACKIVPLRNFCLNDGEWRSLEELSDTLIAACAKQINTAANSKSSKKIIANLQEQLALYEADRAFIDKHLYFPNSDRYLRTFYGARGSLFRYLELLNAHFLLNEMSQCYRNSQASEADRALEISTLLEQAQTVPVSAEAAYTHAEIWGEINKLKELSHVAAFKTADNGLAAAQEININGREAESLKVAAKEKTFADKFDVLQNYREENYCFYFFVANKNEHKEIAEIATAKHLQFMLPALATPATAALTATAAEIEAATPERITAAKGGGTDVHAVKSELDPPTANFDNYGDNLPQGFTYPAAGIMVLGSAELWRKRRKQRRHGGREAGAGIIDFFNDIKIGDYVVHDVHGIGIYRGLKTISTGGSANDYLHLEYAGDDALYLPMSALDQLQKYIGVGEKAPRLSKFGGADWQKLKERSRSKIKQLATDLVDLYAKRRSLSGFAFSRNANWEEEFAAEFPFVETEDQLTACAEIFADMERDKVMDRLLCGDVGFGKTELAFRAAFKAVLDDKQVAFVAPTTVLTQQHFENFQERVKNWPVKAGVLSRFSTPAQIEQVLKGLRTGAVQVVFGTHRLLSKDVKFKDLGLLIVDEEQRFGVDHKEQLKAAYPQVDVLTLSATPIPRTLHMAMSGIRDISVLNQAPAARKTVRTYVMEYDLNFLQAAINREIQRGGQIFFLFNNTQKIYRMQEQLQQLLPKLRIAVAHGKLREQTLEQVIAEFVAGEADLLLCTTIIESGVDMPNVNTLIVTNADRLGLAQLYQLRGRVGRGDRQAYAYITYEPEKVLTEQARKRLQAIREFTELGSGLKIALQDLEVRGAGNLIGAEQHGQIAGIGYDMYCRMLDEEIATAKGEEKIHHNSELANSLNTQINLKINAYIEREAVPLESERLDLYRRISRIDGFAAYLDMCDEINDRFGTISDNLQNLLDVAYVRAVLFNLGVVQLNNSRHKMEAVFSKDSKLPMQKLSALLQDSKLAAQLHFLASVPAVIEISNVSELNASQRLQLLVHWFRRSYEA